MKLKTFQASSMPLALAQVKRELGADAVILGTRAYRTSGLLGFGRRNVVEITATVDREILDRVVQRKLPGAAVSAPIGPAPMDARVRKTYGQLVAEARQQAVSVSAAELRQELNGLKDVVQGLVRETRSQKTPDVPPDLFDMYVALLSNEVAEELARDLVRRICAELPESQWRSATRVRECLVRYVASRIEVAGPTQLEGPTPRVIAFIGPTGVGKTTTIAKLAAQFKLRQGHSVGLVTIDTYRIAAVDQLRTYADIIDVPLKVVLTPRELRRAVDEFGAMDFILIDTAGRGQRDALKMNELRQFLDVVRPGETHLVVSSATSPRTVEAVIDKFGEFKIDRIILTKLDEAVGFGIVLTVLERARQKLSYVTVGQDVPNDIEPGDPRKLAELIVPTAAMSTKEVVR